MFENNINNKERRRIIKMTVAAFTLAPMGNLLWNRRAEARGSRAVSGETTEIPKLPETDPQAKALAYTEDAATVDTANYRRVEGATCSNCALYTGTDGEAWGPCAIFSYRKDPKLNRSYVVSAKGWCRSWSARA